MRSPTRAHRRGEGAPPLGDRGGAGATTPVGLVRMPGVATNPSPTPAPASTPAAAPTTRSENPVKLKRSPRRPRLAAPTGSRPLLTLREVGGVLGVKLRTLQSWRATGKLRVLVLSKRCVRVEQSEVDRLIEEARR